jgi:hypothetical protein
VEAFWRGEDFFGEAESEIQISSRKVSDQYSVMNPSITVIANVIQHSLLVHYD